MSLYSLLKMTSPLRDAFQIWYHDFGDASKTPKIVFVGGIHGDELNATFVLSRLAHFLSTLSQGPKGETRLVERVLILPAVNVVGINTQHRFWPFDNTDINRMFPGYSGGETTQRIAAAVFELTKTAHYRVDIHASNADFEELPQVRLYEPTETERRTARLFELPAIIERRSNRIVNSTIGQAWKSCGGENFVLQAGMAGHLQPEHCEKLFQSLVSFLVNTGILKNVDLPSNDEEPRWFGPDQSVSIISEQAGLFVSKLKVGRWMTADEPLGAVYDSLTGAMLCEIKAPVSGLLVGLRRQPLLCEGDLIANIQSKEPLPARNGPDLYSGRSQ